MRDRITLPRLLSFRLTKFQPIFEQDVVMNVSAGPNIILGGNGLGKTTIMQAVIYGLTGGSDGIEDEKDKALRWNHNYFRKRLNPEHVSEASVEVEFAFGKTVLSVCRGFNNSNVIAFKKGRSQHGWINDPVEAKATFEGMLTQYGGYEKPEDFAFVVHRLPYLPETRRLLAWDTNAQIRIIMLLNQDVLIEEDFRKRREELKKLDSSKRHLHVALGKIEKRIAESKARSKKSAKNSNSGSASAGQNGTDYKRLLEKLQEIARQRHAIEKDRREASEALNKISSGIEVLREQIEQTEAFLISGLLSDQEKQSHLAINKMAESGICPVCGIHQKGLQELAHQHTLEHRCLLCGSENPQQTEPELATLRSQLAEKLRSQKVRESTFRTATNKLEYIRREEDRLQYEVNSIRLSQPALTLIERDLPSPSSRKDLVEMKAMLERQEDDLQAQIIERRSQLERDYRVFRDAVNTRINLLRSTYATYATEFLGIPCELTETMATDLISFTRFIPKFNNIERDTPESCSEAQRFFLDIAFRMALIDFASNSTKDNATFVCETPESALDMSYIDNVVRMFSQFSEKGHSLLLTANIQSDSIAGALLELEPKDERASRILNLLDIGQLSQVHKDALPKLRAAVRSILR